MAGAMTGQFDRETLPSPMMSAPMSKGYTSPGNPTRGASSKKTCSHCDVGEEK